jgi:hypothetical protein
MDKRERIEKIIRRLNELGLKQEKSGRNFLLFKNQRQLGEDADLGSDPQQLKAVRDSKHDNSR